VVTDCGDHPMICDHHVSRVRVTRPWRLRTFFALLLADVHVSEHLREDPDQSAAPWYLELRVFGATVVVGLRGVSRAVLY
jgi:hypothetical protein